MSEQKIAGVIVLYNPEDTVTENISTYIDNIDILYAIDNSEKDISELLAAILANEKIIYKKNVTNLGIAAALNLGAKCALEQGYEWLLTMDQDSSFKEGIFPKYLNALNALDNMERVAIISPNHDEHVENKVSLMYEYEECIITMTSGNLLNLNLYKSIGGFEDKLFIDEVDHDYCIRARILGFKIIKFYNIPLNHKLGDLVEITKKSKKFFITIHASQRMYYITRNNLYMIRKYRKVFPSYFRERIRQYFLYDMRVLILYENNKAEKFYYIFRGILDFIRGKYGKFIHTMK